MGVGYCNIMLLSYLRGDTVKFDRLSYKSSHTIMIICMMMMSKLDFILFVGEFLINNAMQYYETIINLY